MTSNSPFPPMPQPAAPQPAAPKQQALALIFGGLLPVIAFTVIEDQYGVVAGLLAGMFFGLGEVIYELLKHRKVSAMTWAGNGLLILLGGISLISDDGIWFKLQPALFEFAFGAVLLGSSLMKKPFLLMMLEKQNPNLPEAVKDKFKGVNLRTSFFFFFHAILATYAAFYWSTWAWAFLKGVGLMGSFVVYLAAEIIFIRRSLQKPPKKL